MTHFLQCLGLTRSPRGRAPWPPVVYVALTIMSLVFMVVMIVDSGPLWATVVIALLAVACIAIWLWLWPRPSDDKRSIS